jgi:hypothetical protein
MRLLLAVLLAAIPLYPQTTTTHSVIISWTAPDDADPTTTYSVWRISSPCPGQPGAQNLAWVPINAAPITGLSYTDANLQVGTYCYAATQTQGVVPNTVRSAFSNMLTAKVTPHSVVISGSPG